MTLIREITAAVKAAIVARFTLRVCPTSMLRRGTFGAHDLAVRRKPMRTAEIAAAAQRACSSYPPRSATPGHKTRPTGRLVGLSAKAYNGSHAWYCRLYATAGHTTSTNDFRPEFG